MKINRDLIHTWVDVEQLFVKLQRANKWLKGVALWAFTSRFTFEYTPSVSVDEIKQWLRDNLNNHDYEFFVEEPTGCYFKLGIAIEGYDRLPIRFKELEEADIVPGHYSTSLKRPFSIRKQEPVKKEPPFDHPRIVAFHSFKGGVGRTLHAVGLAQHLIQDRGLKVLLIDADFEAPGISWLFQNSRLTLADFMVLLHAANSESDYPKIIAYFKEHIQAFGTQLFILPALPTVGNYQLTITPDNVNSMTDNPFFLNHRLIQLGHALGVDYILVDLRAGKSELASGWLLDPEVYKVLVTTLSSQSVQGTIEIMKLMEKSYQWFDGEQDKHLSPFLVISQVPESDISYKFYKSRRYFDLNAREDDLIKNEVAVRQYLKLIDAYSESFLPQITASIGVNIIAHDSKNQINSTTLNPSIARCLMVTPHRIDLIALPDGWEKVSAVIRRELNEFKGEDWQKLFDWLPEPVPAPNLSETSKENIFSETNDNLKRLRSEIVNYFTQVADAKPGEHRVFVYTKSIQKLINSFLTKPTTCIISADEGNGMKSLFLELIKQKTLSSFIHNYNPIPLPTRTIFIPFFFPNYLTDSTKK